MKIQVLLDKQLGQRPVKITTDAKRKANYISKRVCEIAKEPLEVGFYLVDTKPNELERVVRDIYIGPEQTVTKKSCKIDGLGKQLAYDEIVIQKKMRIIGWGHSHAFMGNFFSDEDLETTLNEMDNFGITNKVKMWVPDNELKLFPTTESEPGHVKFVINKRDYIIDIGCGLKKDVAILSERELPITYVVGLTFNALGREPYCALGYSYLGTKRVVKAERLQTVEENNAIELDPYKIDLLLCQRVDRLRPRIADAEQEIKEMVKGIRYMIVKAFSCLKKVREADLQIIPRNSNLAREHQENLSALLDCLDSIETVKDGYHNTKSGKSVSTEYMLTKQHGETLLHEVKLKTPVYRKQLEDAKKALEDNSLKLSHNSLSRITELYQTLINYGGSE